jgi:hypothetical protein
VLVAGCSSSSSADQDGGPVQGSYTIEFTNVSVPVYADAIRVNVFGAAADSSAQCLSLIDAEKSGGTLPPTAPGAPAKGFAPCELISGAGVFTLPFGSYAVLVVAQKGGQDIARGCAEQTISAAAPSMSVPVEILDVTIPTTTCSSLTQRCATPPTCQ